MTRTHRLTIAERLRQGAGHEPADIMAAEKTMDEAAAEIERLQAHMRALADTSVARDTAGIFKGLWQGSERECEELRTEIERLKADNKEMRGALIQVRARFQRLRLGPDEEQTLDRVNAALEPKP